MGISTTCFQTGFSHVVPDSSKSFECDMFSEDMTVAMGMRFEFKLCPQDSVCGSNYLLQAQNHISLYQSI